MLNPGFLFLIAEFLLNIETWIWLYNNETHLFTVWNPEERFLHFVYVLNLQTLFELGTC